MNEIDLSEFAMRHAEKMVGLSLEEAERLYDDAIKKIRQCDEPFFDELAVRLADKTVNDYLGWLKSQDDSVRTQGGDQEILEMFLMFRDDQRDHSYYVHLEKWVSVELSNRFPKLHELPSVLRDILRSELLDSGLEQAMKLIAERVSQHYAGVANIRDKYPWLKGKKGNS